MLAGIRGYVPVRTLLVNSRLTGRGIPVSCEVDLYGALSEYIGWCISGEPVTLLDINNSVPKDMYHESIEGKFSYPWKHTDTFMGFHCGNTCSTRLQNPHIAYQKIMANTHPADWCDGTMEGDIKPGEITFYRLQSTADGILRAYAAQKIMANTHPADWCDGTMEGDIKPGEITFYRLQSTADGILRAYAAEGEVLPVATKSFGSIGVFAIPEMGRFYRYELIEKNYPHHGVAPSEIGYNHPSGVLYASENPFGGR